MTLNFSLLRDLLDRYVATYGSLNSKKYLTMGLLKIQTTLMPTISSHRGQSVDKTFYLEDDGIISPRTLRIRGSLFYAMELLVRDAGNETMDIAEMNMIGTEWEVVTNAMAEGFMRSGSLYCEAIKMDEKFSNSVFFVLSAVKELIRGLLSTSTIVDEDNVFSAAVAAWDGFVSFAN
jgi:hypothetical protein